MKNTLMIPLVFVGYLILCMFLLSVFTVPSSYNSLMTLAAGNWHAFAVETVCMALYLFPLAAMLAFLFVFFFLMRHKSVIFLTVPLVAVLILTTVVVLLPFSYRLYSRYEPASVRLGSKAETEGKAIFPAGMIRQESATNRAVWLDIYGAGERAGPVIIVDTSVAADKPALSIYPESVYLPKTGQIISGSSILLAKGGGEDPLITGQLVEPRFLQSLVRDICSVLDAFRHSFESGIRSYYLTTGSFFLAVCCLWLLCYAAGWRLLNALLVLASFRLLFMGYPWTIDGPLFAVVRKFAPPVVRPDMVSPVLYAAFSAVVLFVGLAVFLKRKFFRKRSAASYV